MKGAYVCMWLNLKLENNETVRNFAMVSKSGFITMGRHIKNDNLSFVKKDWIGNRVHQGRFLNRNLEKNHGVKHILKWRLSPNPQFKEKFFDKWKAEVIDIVSLDEFESDNLIWLGHSSFYVSIDGKRMMFDPVFGNIPFVRRKSKLPASPSIFKDIDYLFISHDHFDHMDKSSIRTVCEQSPNIVVMCGLGVDDLVKKWLPNVKVVGMAWYQQFVDGGMKFTFMQSLHWSKRSAQDGGRRLWGAFVVESYSKKLYFSGDTGYGTHFKELPNLFGQIDYAIIGIGAYKPRWLMERNHISPIEALDAAEDMNAKMVIPMHYGTFNLSDEPLSDPPKVFKNEAIRRNMNFYIPNIGEMMRL